MGPPGTAACAWPLWAGSGSPGRSKRTKIGRRSTGFGGRWIWVYKSFLTHLPLPSVSAFSLRGPNLCHNRLLTLHAPNAHYREGNGTPLQYSCLENPMGGGTWWAAVHGVAGSQTRLSDFTFTHWRRKWQPTPVFLPGESQGWRSLVGCHLWSCTESDTTEVTYPLGWPWEAQSSPRVARESWGWRSSHCRA